MCGLVAFSGPHLDHALLGHLFVEAGRRGPHASAVAFWRDAAWWRAPAHHGPLAATDVEGICDVTAIVGHSRLATCGTRPGSLPPLDECQPLLSWGTAPGGILVAHNGRVPASEHPVDSVSLLEAWRDGATLAEAARLCAEAPSAIIAARGSTLYAYRHPGSLIPGQPLWAREDESGTTYLCSRRFDGARLLDEGTEYAWN